MNTKIQEVEEDILIGEGSDDDIEEKKNEGSDDEREEEEEEEEEEEDDDEEEEKEVPEADIFPVLVVVDAFVDTFVGKVVFVFIVSGTRVDVEFVPTLFPVLVLVPPPLTAAAVAAVARRTAAAAAAAAGAGLRAITSASISANFLS